MKAIIGIYDIIMFFVLHGKRVVELAKTVFGAVTDIANGDTGKAAAKIKDSLTMSLPLIFHLLLRMLRLGDLGKKILGVITEIVS